MNKVNFLGLVIFLSSCQAKAGDGVDFLKSSLLFFSILIISILILFVRQIREKKKRSNLSLPKVFYQKFRLPIFVILAFLVSIIFVNFFLEGQHMRIVLDNLKEKKYDAEQELKFVEVEKEEKDILSKKQIIDRYKKDSLNDWVFIEYVKALIVYESNPFRESEVSWKSHIKNTNDKFRQAIIAYYDHNIGVQLYLDDCDETKTGVNFFYGKIYFDTQRFIEAEKYFLKEVKHNGWKKRSLNYLKRIYKEKSYIRQITEENDLKSLRYRRIQKFMELYEYSELHPFLPKSKTLILTASVFNSNTKMYMSTFIDIIFLEQTNISVFIGAWIIFIAWMYFLWQQNPFSQIHYSKFIISGLNGFAAFVLLIPVYFYMTTLLVVNFGENSLVYFLCGVGFFEELIKIFPVLIFALVYGKKEEPYHYMVIAALSALLFSTLENKLYFERYSIQIMNIRGLFTVIIHIFDTSLITYLLVWRLFQKNGKGVVLWTIIGFVLAVVSHGLYDWFLNNELKLIALIMFPFSVHILADMYNNTLNIARSFDYQKLHFYKKNTFVITGALVLIIITRYVFIAVDYHSAEFANDLLAGSAFSTFYLLVFLSMSLGRMDIFYGYWKKIGIPTSFFQLVFPRVVNSNDFLHRKVRIALKNNFEVVGEIKHRTVFEKADDWYILELDKLVKFGTVYTKHLLINFEDHDAVIDEDYFCAVLVGVPLNGINGFDGIYYHGQITHAGGRFLTRV